MANPFSVHFLTSGSSGRRPSNPRPGYAIITDYDDAGTGHPSMKMVFTHENTVVVGHVRGLLEQAGLKVQTRNEFAGGGSGEIPIFETWPELWVEEGYAEMRAGIIIEKLTSQTPNPPWTCHRCGEVNDDSFDFCWRCGAEAALSAADPGPSDPR